MFLLFKPNAQEEPKPVAPMTPGHIGWHKLYAGDPDREFAFYSRLFGWSKDRAIDLGPMGTYQTFATGGAPCGGMIKACAQMPGPCWNYYIAVDSVSAAARSDRSQRPDGGPGRRLDHAGALPQGAAFAMVSAGK